MVYKLSAYKEEVHCDWCPGCGDFGILAALQNALTDLQIEPSNTVIVSGIGCSGKIPHYVKTYGIHTLHGRVLPFALGIKLANPNLEVIAVGGDGDGLSIGVGHFVNAGRRNVDLTYIVHDNGVYALTKGQASPTLGRNLQTKSLPAPNINDPVNPIALALVSGYTFIARSYAYDVKYTKEIIKRAILHRGTAFVDILQPCPTYNDIQSKEWYAGLDKPNKKSRIYKLDEHGYSGYVKSETDFAEKYMKVIEYSRWWGDNIPVGVFIEYDAQIYEARISLRIKDYLQNPPALQKYYDENTGRVTVNIKPILEKIYVT